MFRDFLVGIVMPIDRDTVRGRDEDDKLGCGRAC